jgi:hypothetical protein
MSATAVVGRAEAAVRDVAPWVEKLARLGFVAKALMYTTIGVLAGAAALRLGGSPATGSRGAMAKLLDAPFGHVLLGIIAAGLFGYAAWRLIDGVIDPEHHGTHAKGIAKRVQSIVIGMIHVGIGISAIKLATGDMSAARDGGSSQHWAAKALATPGGALVLYLVAAGFVIYGVYQLYRAWKAKLDKHLALGRMSHGARRFVVGASRFGIAARGIVFGMIGVLLARAVRTHDASQARGIKQAMAELFSFGRIPFALIAAGLVAYGLYQLLNARYRRINVA